jgi:hypothetical protein
MMCLIIDAQVNPHNIVSSSYARKICNDHELIDKLFKMTDMDSLKREAKSKGTSLIPN